MSCDWCKTEKVHLNKRDDSYVCDQCADEVDDQEEENRKVFEK